MNIYNFNFKNILKIIFSILSYFIIFYYTNIAKPCLSKIDDGNYFNNNSLFGKLVNHKPGYVCPLGVYLGKIMIIFILFQIYYIAFKKL